MKKQVKVNVFWNGDTVHLTTEKGAEFDFVIGNKKRARFGCETAIATHIAALLVPTVSEFCNLSESMHFSFTLTACDTI